MSTNILNTDCAAQIHGTEPTATETPAITAQLTIIKTKVPVRLSKSFALAKDGTVEKLPGGQLVSGECHVKTIRDLSDLARILSTLTSDCALVYGIPTEGAQKVMSRKAFEHAGQPSDTTTRTKDAFSFPDGAGVMMIDYDPPKDGTPPLSREELVAKIINAIPTLATYNMLWCPSASSCIFNDNIEVFGIRGQRLYLIVKNAADIPRAGKVLVELLWKAGLGHFEVSKSGALLERTLVDSSVWQPNRLDFAGGAHCTPPLRQDRGKPYLIRGKNAVVDTREVLPELTPSDLDRVRNLKHEARQAKATEAEAARSQWIKNRVAETLSADALENPELLKQTTSRLLEALNDAILRGDFRLHVEINGRFETVSVAEILKNPSRYHGANTLDPIEPDYDGGRVVGRLFLLQSRPYLHSFAHGGKTYQLRKDKARIQLTAGQMAEATEQTLVLLRQDPLVFDYGDAIVIVADGHPHAFDEYSLANYLGQSVQFWKMKTVNRTNINVDINPPNEVVRQILSLKERRKLKKLNAVITAPLVTPDKEVIDQPGYHAATQLFLDTSGEIIPPIPKKPSREEALNALNILMAPFKSFPFVDEKARGAMLAAILSAIERPVLPTAPAFAFDAPTQGSGKSLLSACVGYLATGELPDIFPHTKGRDDEETRKRMFAALYSGSGAIVWDNVTGSFDSAAMAALLTTPTISDRVLGRTQTLRLPNRSLIMFTGNNLTFEGDMARRVIKSRIDPKTATPFAREFATNPLEHIRDHRLEMVAAGCTLILAYLDSKATRAPGRMASFETWDDVVRQTVVWVGTELAPGEYGDPMELLREAAGEDPTIEVYGDFLKELLSVFGNEWFSSKEVQNACKDNRRRSLNSALNELGYDGIAQSSKRIGKLLSSRKGQIASGMRLVAQRLANNNGLVYRVEQIENN